MRHLALICGLLGIGGGIAALVGWALDISVFKSWLPGESTMKPTTALGIVLLGAATLSLGLNYRRALGFAAAGVVVLLAVITLVEHITGWQSGLGTLMFPESVDSFRTEAPGRMGENTALAFLIMGVGLLLWEVRPRGSVTPTNVAILVSGMVALAALIGYVGGVEDEPGLSATVSSMSVPTAVALLLIVGAGLLARTEHGILRLLSATGAGGEMLRWALPVAVLAPVFLGLLVTGLVRTGALERSIALWLIDLLLVLAFGVFVIVLSRRLATVDAERQHQTRTAERSAAELAALAGASQELGLATNVDQVRGAACAAARRIARAPLAVFVEPDLDRGRPVAADSSLDPGPNLETVIAGKHFAEMRTGRGRVASADVIVSKGLTDLLGASTQTAMWQPLLQGGSSVGALLIGWDQPVERLPASTASVLALLASETSVALDRISILQRLDFLARTDELTGLPNRRSWEEHLARELARARRSGEALTVALLDLDHFKRFNDTFGHQAGDRALREAAGSWSSKIRASDVIARYGGEEFGLLLPSCDQEQGFPLLERLRLLTPNGITCSAGLAMWDGTESGESVVARADTALYEAKRLGRAMTVAAPEPQLSEPPR